MPRTSTAACVALGIALLAPVTDAAEPLAVIVHPSRTTRMNRTEVARIYLRTQRFWGDGQPIVAINREAGSRAREQFSERVLGSETSWLPAYWNEQYFQGVFPPATLSSGAAVKRFVASDRNAIGYIEAGEVDESVTVVLPLP
jgi:ABC-type phosphate transport system substrate-binding protein